MSSGLAPRLGDAYRETLRRARAVGWERARVEYASTQRELGSSSETIRDDLDAFDRLNIDVIATGSDPVTLQQRRDWYVWFVRPGSIAASALAVGLAAARGLGPLESIGAGICVGALIRLVGRALLRPGSIYMFNK